MTIEYIYFQFVFEFSGRYHILVSRNVNSKGLLRLMHDMPHTSPESGSFSRDLGHLPGIEMTLRIPALLKPILWAHGLNLAHLHWSITATSFFGPEASFTRSFFFKLTQVKLLLEVQMTRELGRRVSIYFFEFYSQWQHALNLAVSVAHTHCQ